jgi:hypothetical protein
MAQKSGKYSRRTIALFWLVVTAVVIGIILYLEQVALLYVLATVGLVSLLLIVGFADLENVGRDEGSGLSARD